jgi:hypothetical protein
LLDEAETTRENHVRDLSIAFLADVAKDSRYASELLQRAASSRNLLVQKKAQEEIKRIADAEREPK